MTITKLGHCCLILEHDGLKILTDPGSFTTEEVKSVIGLHVILITHEHQDHYHIGSIEVVLKNNPTARIIANSAVAKLLKEKNYEAIVVGDGQSANVNGVIIEGFGRDHAPIYGTEGLPENTGYFVANKFYFPGDSFYDPGKPVEVLALPVAGPWMKLSEAIDFAKLLKPRIAFGVHDGMIVPGFGTFVTQILQKFLKPGGIEYLALGHGERKDF